MPRPKKDNRAERARQALKGAGITREDSDDELGTEDYPWEWIYEDTTEPPDDGPKPKSKSPEQTPDEEEDELLESPESQNDRRRKRKLAREPSKKQKIIGAKMGPIFQCKLGDPVLLKSENAGEAYVGLIIGFREEDDGEKMANFMWFDRAKAVEEKRKKHSDLLPNELYITHAYDENPLQSVNGSARIMSKDVFDHKYPNGKVPRRQQEKVFICRRGYLPRARAGIYTDDFIWEDIYSGSPEDIYAMVERLEALTAQKKQKLREAKEAKENRRTRAEDKDGHYEPNDQDDDEYQTTPRTPKKRKINSAASTPGSRKRQKLTTPSHKRIQVKAPLTFTPLSTRLLSPTAISSPFQLARHQLHVSSVPASLPGRETEFQTVYDCLESAIISGSGSCIYISGTPGTGKTATVREVISQLNGAVQADELDDFIFVEINGMKVTDPHQSYSLLWEALKSERVSPSHALSLLDLEFSHPNPRRVPCVVLMDELDQLVTKNQSVMYNFFNWPVSPHSRLIVLAVANTMDLPERTLSNKISSRLGLTRITFPGYKPQQLMKIIEARLEGVPGNIVDPDAVQFASRKVAAVSGDARRALDICRRAVEIAESEASALTSTTTTAIASNPPTPSKHGRNNKNNNSTTNATRNHGRVTISTIKTAITEATTSPLQQSLRSLPLSTKLFLSSLLSRVRRTGLAESVLSDVLSEARNLASMASNPQISQFLLGEGNPYSNGGVNAKGNGNVYLGGSGGIGMGMGKVPRVLSMGAAAVELMEAGIVSLEMRKGGRTGKVRLNVGEDEVRLALKDDVEVKGLGFG
ncbi:MAG: Origin recognition complex, subunit 1 [Cirrosporium novae-zelandiae]|nr:MAG: Origin recognition complex, subunit 1 [Cirrosporium novae-zelandiae]